LPATYGPADAGLFCVGSADFRIGTPPKPGVIRWSERAASDVTGMAILAAEFQTVAANVSLSLLPQDRFL
jgi:hypothetical protein